MSQEPNITQNPAETEPKSGLAAMPMWLMLVMALLTYRGCLQVDKAGGFQAKVYPPYHSVPPQIGGTEDPMAKGKKLYDVYCAICHQGNGLGVPGQFPPLAGSDWVQVEGVNRIARIVFNGVQGPIKVNGVEYSNAMPPWKDMITSDDDVAAILTFIRGSWGNKASAATAAEVKAIREDEKARGTAWSADELLKLPVK
jgi:mono/diheme cytochrome c family protein